MENKWGFIRETTKKAIEAGKDKSTGLGRTGLDEYLNYIFPNTFDWIHDCIIDDLPKDIKSQRRPDYRSKSLMLVVEFDGIQHYNNPCNIIRDIKGIEFYESLGYKIVRIPFFIQLTKKSVKTLFDVDIKDELFDETIPSMSSIDQNTPAFLCWAGIQRMAKDFRRFPEQYETNIRALKAEKNQFLVSAELLEKAYNNSPVAK